MISRRKFPRLVVLLASLVGICLTLSYAGPKAHADTRQQQFLAVIKYLADYVDLTDQAEVDRILGTQLALVRHWSNPPGDCKDPINIRVSEGDAYVAAPGFWYKWTPDGKHVMTRRGIADPPGPDTAPRDPSFGYMVTRTTDCSERFHAVEPRVEAEIRFDYTPGFACITEDDLRSGLPGGETPFATDGGQPYWYRGKTTEDYGVLVDTERSPCAGGFLITQNERYGKRDLRVGEKLQSCLKERFINPPHKDNDFEYCGTFWTLMQDELGRH